MSVFLAFDVGTTAMKCCAFDEAFQMVASATTEYQLSTKGEHIVEVDPELYWKGLCSSVRQIFAAGVKPTDIAAMGITTQGETTIVLDENDKPLFPAIVWLDDRAGQESDELTAAIGEDKLFRTTGLPSISGAAPIAKLKWLMAQPEAKQIKKILLLEDYLIYRLTGAFVTEHSLVCSTGYYDIMQHKYAEDFLKLAGVPLELLPQVLPCGTQAGTVTEAAAAATGFAAGTPVVCTAMDQTASAVGANNIAAGIVSETTGTCLTVVATTDKPDFDTPAPLTYYTHYDGKYLAMTYNPTAAAVVKWFKDLCIAATEDCKASGLNAYDYMDKLASEIVPGSDGLLLIPHFAGKAMPESVPEMRGCFMGLGVGTSKGHMIRAIMEGVAFMLRENLDAFQAAGIPVSTIRSLGGGARDLVWSDIKASVTGCTLVTTQQEESTSLGAAIMAASAVGFGDVPSLCEKAVKIGRTNAPDPKKQEIYDRLYQKYLLLDRLAADYAKEAAKL